MVEAIHELDASADTIIVLRNPGAPFAVWEEPVAASPFAQLPEKSAFDDGWPPSNRGLTKSQQRKARRAAQKKASLAWGLDDEFEAASPVIGPTEDSTTNLDSLFDEKQSNEAEASSSTPPSVETPPSNEPSEPIMPEQEEQGGVHYYVSSRHLALASGFSKVVSQRMAGSKVNRVLPMGSTICRLWIGTLRRSSFYSKSCTCATVMSLVH